ncbi:tetratricopeptide repeat protein [Nocardia huaxiensis]|uniref:Tetratricopeptide repeat protein n=1 Tax=Nocardia huaxiensis TaxID=2755382 RepID=A0A7D6ZJN0_9NOCA|nr:tetratricopeptide repeat protein [Nocardia huaxiensis]QLY32207.1 tetratricopeptide repeat protein [Nocardia huaxiensis]
MPKRKTCDGCPCSPADKEERRGLRDKLHHLGITGRQLDEQLAAELRQRGHRPRVAWRLSRELSQQSVADEFNALSDRDGMRASRISEYERWPFAPDGSIRPEKGARPGLESLRTLANIYGTTWDQLLDLADLEHQSEEVKAEFRETVAQRTTDRSAVFEGELPPEVPHFTGRLQARAELQTRVRQHIHRNGGPVHVLDGVPGVGKTALARYAVTEFARQYPDGAIWVDLFGFTPKREPRSSADLLERLLLEIDVPRETIEAEPDRRAAQWREAMRSRRMLIVFDNAANTAQVRDLLPDSAGSFVLVTSRGRLVELVGAQPMHLDVMDPGEAEELLAKFANLRVGQYDRTAVGRIVEAAGRLPLALKLFGSQLAHHDPSMLAESAADLTALTAELRRTPVDDTANRELAESILDRFAAGEESVRTTFERWYQRLRDPELQRTVRLLGSFPGPEISAEPLAAMADVPLGRAKTLIRRLFEACLLDPLPGGSHYRMHDMTKLYASLLADPGDGLPSAMDRLVVFALAVARRASLPSPADSPVRATGPADGAQARAWLTRERELLVGCVENAGASAQTAELARLVASHLCGRGRWSAAYRLYERSATVARELGDRQAEAWALVGLGRVDRLSGRHEGAAALFGQARTLAQSLPDRQCLAEVLCERGKLAWITGEHTTARKNFTKALDTARAIGYQPAECDALDGLSLAHRMVSDYRQARDCSEAMLDVAEDLDDPERIGTGQWGLAECLRLSGDHEAARRHYVNALRIARGINYRKLEGDALRGLGHSERLIGEVQSARTYYEEALAIAQRIHDRYGEGWALWGLGNILRTLGNSREAREYLEQAGRLAIAVNDPLGNMDALRGLGHLERSAADHERACHYYKASLSIARRVGNPQGEADALHNMARVAAEQGNVADACAMLRRAQAITVRLRLPLRARVEERIRQLGC